MKNRKRYQISSIALCITYSPCCSTELYRMYLLDCNASVIDTIYIIFVEITSTDHFSIEIS